MGELRLLLPYLKPYRRGFVAGLVLVVLSNAFGILSPKLVGMAVDALGRPGVGSRLILEYAALIVGVSLLAGGGRFGMRQLLNGLSRRVEIDLRDDLFRHLLRLDASFYAVERTGDLMSRATNDTLAVRQAVGPAVMYTVNTIALSIFALVFMFRIDVPLTLIALLPLVLLPPLVLVFSRKLHQRFQEIQDHFGRLSTMVQENLSGVRIVRAYVQEGAQEGEFDELSRGYLDRNMALARTSGVYRPLLTLLTGLGMVVVLWFGGVRVIQGRISVGDFIAFGFYLSMMNWPMIALGWVTNLFQRGAVAMGRLNAIFRTEPRVAEPPDPVSPPRVRGDIEFRDVHFRYPGSRREVLSGITFQVPAGTTVALVGPTGAGKTTVVALLARLFDPTGGEVLLDGVPLRRLALGRLRKAIGVVPQEAFLFSETIRYNIALGIEDGGEQHGAGPDGEVRDSAVAASSGDMLRLQEARERRVREATRVAQLEEAIEGFPEGLDTRLGERGINLSGGQRQRTALARALARDPEILVLDDALSAVDTRTESRILSGLRRVLPGRTAFVISHRVTAVMGADLILVLDDGRIVERGTHDQLLELGGLYATLLRRQLIEEDLEAGAVAAASGERG